MTEYILIDGIRFEAEGVDGLAAASYVMARAGENEEPNSMTGNLTLRKEAFDLVYEKIVCAEYPKLAHVEIEVFSNCCKEGGADLRLFVGRINGSDVKWCHNECSIEVSVEDASEDAVALTCLKNTLIWDRQNFDGSITSNGEDEFRRAPYVTYCMELRPKILQEFLLLVGMIFIQVIRPIVFIVALIVTVINAIINAVNTLPTVDINEIDFDGNEDTNAFEEMNAFINLITDAIVSCGRKHKSPFIHSYLMNICKLCNLTLSSEHYDVGAYYHNAMRMDAQNFEKGQRQAQDIEDTYIQNRPNLNGVQFLDTLKDFNSKWYIQNGVLYETHETTDTGNRWFAFDQIDSKYIESLCFEFDDSNSFAYGVYEYQKDGTEEMGDEVRPEWVDTVIDWNTPPVDSLAGMYKKNLPYAAAQFRSDVFRPDVAAIDMPLYVNSNVYVNLQNFQNVLLMNKGTTTAPKLLIWDGISSIDDARIERTPAGNGLFYYNERYHIKLNPINRDGAYQIFFFNDDPRFANREEVIFELILNLPCELITEAAIDTTIELPYKDEQREGVVDRINISPSSKTITINGNF